jgi:uncharacterized FlaG/YvyC family protein
MVDQVSPSGSLGPGLTQTLAVAVKAQSVPDGPKAAQSAASTPRGVESGAVAHSGVSPEDASKQVNQYLQKSNSDLTMKVDKATGRTVFTIVRPSGEVLLQVPSAEVLAMARKLNELTKQKGASGVLVDQEG